MQRSGGKCEYCDSLCKVPEIHHVIEFADGGEHTLENLVAICPECHREHTNRYAGNRRVRRSMGVRKWGPYSSLTDEPERKRKKIPQRKNTSWPTRKIASRPLRRN